MRACFTMGHQDVTCERDERGICVHCGQVCCAGCGRSSPADGGDVHEVTYVPGEDSPGYVCTACLDDDSDGIPEEVEEEETSAQTVRATYEPIGAEGLGDVRATRRAA